MGWQFVYDAVAINAGAITVLGLVLNNLVPGRHYPSSGPGVPHTPPSPQLSDFQWALDQMDGIVDVSTEDLLTLYDLAIDHAHMIVQLKK